MHSLRRRLLVTTAIGASLVFVASGFIFYRLLQSSLLREFDTALRDRATTLAGFVEQIGDDVQLDLTEPEVVEFLRTTRTEYFEAWRSNGTVIIRSLSLGDLNLPSEPNPNDPTTIRWVDLPESKRGRTVTLEFEPALDDEAPTPTARERVTLAFVREADDILSALARLRAMLLIVGVTSVSALIAFLGGSINLGLRPVAELAQEISLIDDRNLTQQLPTRQCPRELRPVIDRLNDMLARLHAAFLREKTMTANVAHELRTPLSGIRSILEVTLSRDREPVAYRRAMDECLSICRQTQTVVQTLLAIARWDAGIESFAREHIEVSNLLREAWKSFDEPALHNRLEVDWNVDSSLSLESDPNKLRLVLTNVFDNAVEHAEPGGRVIIRGERNNGSIQIQIGNTGCRLSSEQTGRVFERFWRGDAARTASKSHCGLGLSLCQTIVHGLGGEIAASATNEGLFVLTITMKPPRP